MLPLYLSLVINMLLRTFELSLSNVYAFAKTDLSDLDITWNTFPSVEL